MPDPKKIAIIGGGISGLAAAHELRRLLPGARIVLFEASSRLGGVLKTENIGDYLVEHSADMFTIEPDDALRFCEQLGRAGDLISTQPVQQRAFVATTAGMRPVPSGFSLMLPCDPQAVVDSGLLDEVGAKRFWQERAIPPRHESADESLESFAVRRFGQQMFERLVQPLVSGIYTADPQKLSMQATLNRFMKLEQQHGSLIAAAEAQREQNDHTNQQLAFADQTASGARYDLFRAPRRGMSELVGWIVDDLKNVELNTSIKITEISKHDFGWRLQTDKSIAGLPEDWDGVIVAVSARQAAGLFGGIDADLSAEIGGIEAASCAIAVLGLDGSQISRPFSGYGIVVPAALQRNLIAASFSSNKFAGRAPAGKILIRAFIGGAMQAEKVEWPDEELLAAAQNELNEWLGIDGTPELARVYRWRTTMPQYHVGHLDRVARIAELIAKQPGLELAGNSYNGVGIPVCLAEGRQAAERINQFWRQT